MKAQASCSTPDPIFRLLAIYPVWSFFIGSNIAYLSSASAVSGDRYDVQKAPEKVLVSSHVAIPYDCDVRPEQ